MKKEVKKLLNTVKEIRHSRSSQRLDKGRLQVFKNKTALARKLTRQEVIEILAYYDQFGIDVRKHLASFEWYYSQTGKRDPRFIPEWVYGRYILPYFNEKKVLPAYLDKNYLSALFPTIRQPKIVLRKMNGYFLDEGYHYLKRSELVDRFRAGQQYIVKEALSGKGGGRGVSFSKDVANLVGWLETIDYQFEDNYVIQEVLEQSEEFSKFNVSSLNTCRVTSLLLPNGEVKILNAFVRFGKNGNLVDNMSSGGFGVAVDLATGITGDFAVDVYGIRYQKADLPVNDFSNRSIPILRKVLSMIESSHRELPYIRVIGWDFAVDKNGDPILIEYNGNFPGLIVQKTGIPFFGDLTDQILAACTGTELPSASNNNG
ncbi:MAG: hypothetical protein LBS41_03725 [Streptococcaceae bacterium]|jgi:hypothetical protein|nr:hypothetical protein [Streptococcaceae bacterium]